MATTSLSRSLMVPGPSRADSLAVPSSTISKANAPMNVAQKKPGDVAVDSWPVLAELEGAEPAAERVEEVLDES